MSGAPPLEVEHLVVDYRARSGRVRAVDDVSFTLAAGETIGLVGESGSGKSTTAQAVLGLVRPTSGSVRVLGSDWATLNRHAARRLRRHIQLVMQNPYSSLNPRMRIGALLSEPLRIYGVPGGGAIAARVEELLDMVGLPASFARRFPFELSGGQRQRASIARALAASPEVLVCDEALSALDVSIQAQVLRLLRDLRTELGLSMLFISHDLSVVQSLCDRVVVMHKGGVVESAPTRQLFRAPEMDYTRRLLGSVLTPDPRAQRKRGRETLPAVHWTADAPHAPEEGAS